MFCTGEIPVGQGLRVKLLNKMKQKKLAVFVL
jgi:hypothetical protein